MTDLADLTDLAATDDAATTPRSSPVLVAGLIAAAAIAAGGIIHLVEWFDSYKDLPDVVPGVEVVQYGFPLNFAGSVVLAIALVVAVVSLPRFVVATVAANVLFQVGSLFALVFSRYGSLFGWEERIWTPGAKQTLVAEVIALVALAACGGLRLRDEATSTSG